MTKTAFLTEWSIYCYIVMPFGLKTRVDFSVNGQRTAPRHDHKEVEVYVDDMIVKSKDGQGHIANLRNSLRGLRS